jgi:Ser/Thr protein kinase RdoA (MazF antagonist)
MQNQDTIKETGERIMLNKSMLIDSDIQKILIENYNIKDINKIELITNGSACIYVIDNDLQKFILKEYQDGYSVNSLINEYKICRFLNKNGINTSEILKTNEGAIYYEYKKRSLTVQKHIEGYVPKQNEAPEWLIIKSGQLLGKINKVLQNYDIERYEFKKEWFEKIDINKKIVNCQEYIKSAKEKNNEYTDRIIKDMEYKTEKIKELYKININNNELTYANSHGDYNLLQLLCKGTSINAVIDFASACNLPIIWEIIRSFTIASKKCKESEIDINSLVEYLENYLLHYSLNRKDILNIFKMYSLQLLRSEYGYREYFKDEVYDKIKLLKFGFWRTNLVRNMLENEEEYKNILVKWYDKRL